MEKILRVHNLTKTYGTGEGATHALKGIDFYVLPGEFVGIMGPSGSGKTTLLNCIATVIRPTGGQVFVKDQNISALKPNKLARYRGKEIGYLFQHFELLDNLTAGENITLPLSIHGEKPIAQNQKLQKLANQLDIDNLLDKFPSQLSGGEKQRVGAARALITDPDVVLADEPTGALDSKNGKMLMEKLNEVRKTEGTTLLMVTHDANAASYCSRIIFIQDGQLFHELRRDTPGESRQAFYTRIVSVVAQLGGGSANVL